MKKRILIIVVSLLLLAGCGTADTTAGVRVTGTPWQTQQASADRVTATPSNFANEINVHFMDVGQGDSIFIELTGSRCMLIDASTAEYGQKIINYIRGLGYGKIDFLVATHPHADHIGGMKSVVEAFDIGKIYMPRRTSNTKTYENLLLAIRDKGCKINTAKAGVSILQEAGLRINIIAPKADTDFKDTNDYSAVIRLAYGKRAFVFTGDAEAVSEGLITGDISADVLKVGHHGSSSSTSDAFLSRVGPQYAVISVGEGNTYGHPHKETLNKLDGAGITVLRTDQNGDIVFCTDGEELTFSVAKEMEGPEQTPQARQMVYITKSGGKYHTKDCAYLGDDPIAVPLEEAVKEHEPCSRCKPTVE